MHLRQAECNVCLEIAIKLHEFVYQCSIVEILEPATREFSPGFETRIFLEAIVAAKVVFIEQQVYLPTPLAAEVFVFTRNDL